MKWLTQKAVLYGALLASGLALGAGCGGPREKRIVLLTNANSPFWDTVRSGMQAGEKAFDLQAAGLKAVMEVNDGTPEGQISKLRQFGSQSDIVAIAVSPIVADNVAVADEMRRLQERGVQIIALDNDLDRNKFRDARRFYMGTDNRVAGQQAGIAAKNLDPEGGGYVQFVGRTGAQNAAERMDGFDEAAGDKFKRLDRMGDEVDLSKARDNVRNAIGNFPDLKVLVGIWSYNAPAIVDVVQELGRRKDFTIVTFDAEKLAIAHMGAGQIDAMVVQNPYNMGYQAVRLLKALVEKDNATVKELFPDEGQPDGDLYDTGLKVVVPDDKSPLKAEMFGQSVEFMDLDQFKKWLAEHHLESS